MSRIPLAFRAIALLLVLAILPWSAAAEPLQRAAQFHIGSAAAPLTSLWSWLINLWEKNGCGLDPWGRCLPSTVPAQPTGTDNGCMIDPDGRCRVTPAKNGCGLDPHGGCTSGTSAAPAPPASPDNGCGLDPNGRCSS